MRGQTPSQTIGPFFSHALTAGTTAYRPLVCSDLTDEALEGKPIRLEGRVVDGDGKAVSDGMVEIWQANAGGEYKSDSGFRGFGRSGTDASGRFCFQTLKPGPVAPGAAPHVHLAVFARGMLNHAFTRVYFSDEREANRTDPVLGSVPAERRETLVAQCRDGEAVYDFEIVLQGKRETVFFDA